MFSQRAKKIKECGSGYVKKLIEWTESFVDVWSSFELSENPTLSEKVAVKVKTPGITKLPKDAWNEWGVKDLVIHFIKIAKKKGKPAMAKAIMNIERWNKNQNPELADKARSVMDALKKSKEWEEMSVSESLEEEQKVPSTKAVIDHIEKLPDDKKKEFLKSKDSFHDYLMRTFRDWYYKIYEPMKYAGPDTQETILDGLWGHLK